MRIAGKLAGCPFHHVTDPETDEQIYRCAECGAASGASAEEFLEMRLMQCKRVRNKAKPPAPAVENTTDQEQEAPTNSPAPKRKTSRKKEK